MLDSLAAPPRPSWNYDGGTIELGGGDIMGNLTIDIPNVKLVGQGRGTVIHGSLTMRADNCELHDIVVRGEGQPYAVKLWHPGPDGVTTVAGVPRPKMSNVWFGPSYEGASDGPVRVGTPASGTGGHGLWLDGAIVGEFRNCIFFGNPGSGVFIDTTVGQWSTNVNRFYGCTANANAAFGFDLVGGGSEGTAWLGGNIESNGLGGFRATNCNCVSVKECDFEHGGTAIGDPPVVTKQVANLLNMNSVNTMCIEDCNFVTALYESSGHGAGPWLPFADRAIFVDGCTGVIKGCRGTRFLNNLDWILAGDGCDNVWMSGNAHTADVGAPPGGENGQIRWAHNKGGRWNG